MSDFGEVLSLFRKMQEAGTKHNESVLVILVTTSAHISVRSHKDCGCTPNAKRCHVDFNTRLVTALVDMYT